MSKSQLIYNISIIVAILSILIVIIYFIAFTYTKIMYIFWYEDLVIETINKVKS